MAPMPCVGCCVRLKIRRPLAQDCGDAVLLGRVPPEPPGARAGAAGEPLPRAAPAARPGGNLALTRASTGGTKNERSAAECALHTRERHAGPQQESSSRRTLPVLQGIYEKKATFALPTAKQRANFFTNNLSTYELTPCHIYFWHRHILPPLTTDEEEFGALRHHEKEPLARRRRKPHYARRNFVFR